MEVASLNPVTVPRFVFFFFFICLFIYLFIYTIVWSKLNFICIIYDKYTNNTEYDYNTPTIQMGFSRKSQLFEYSS